MERAINALKLTSDERLVEDSFWHKVREIPRRIQFTEDAVVANYCAVDRTTPLKAKAFLMGTLAYFIIPTNVVPDFIVWLGYTDDAAALMAAIKVIRTQLRPEH